MAFLIRWRSGSAQCNAETAAELAGPASLRANRLGNLGFLCLNAYNPGRFLERIVIAVGDRKVVASVKGEVVSVADSGDLLTNVTAEQLSEAPRDESVSIKCDGHATIGIYPHDHDQPEFTFLAVLNAEDQLCLSLVGESASKFLGIKPGSAVTVSW